MALPIRLGDLPWRLALVIIAVVAICTVGQISVYPPLLSVFVYCVWNNWHFLRLVAATLPRDILGIRVLLRVKGALRQRLRDDRPIGDIFTREIVSRHPNKVAFVDVERDLEWTFQQIDEFSNQIANYFHTTPFIQLARRLQDEVGLRSGDVAALFMGNCAEFVGVWLGLSKIGVVSAWINVNLKLDSLGQSIRVAHAKCLIAGADTQSALRQALDGGHLDSALPVYVYGQVSGVSATDVSSAMQTASRLSPRVDNPPTFRSVLCYIYTSGTTGLPKAAVFKHLRYFWMATGVYTSFDMRPDDRIYVPMPLYHSAAGVLGVSQTLLHGCTCVIRRKFSAGRFWLDCARFDCTAAQYIGEMCRYLLNQAESEAERRHRVRLIYGNGLRPQLFRAVVQRFGVQRVGEFYGSTEGNSNIVNLDNHEGAVGFLPIYTLLHPLFPVALVKVDETSGELQRGDDGLCIRAKPGESGEVVGRIARRDPLLEFAGYVDADATQKKIIGDVFSKGDSAFASGDVLRMDERGYLQFRDRMGDTFRWKAENVSTTELESVLHKLLGYADATVFGVHLPNTHGRAGMAAIVDENENINLAEFNAKLNAALPPYARPVFLRICAKVDRTGTFKLRKTDLQKDAFDLEKCGADPLYFLNSKSGEYDRLNSQVCADIAGGKLRF